MDYKILDLLFKEITEATKIKDVAYHKIANGRLNPVYKTHTDILNVERWKTVHGENPVIIEQTPILQTIVNSKQAVDIADTKNDIRSSDAFFLFGIDSILIIPVIVDEVVGGIICIASINELHSFSHDEISKCEYLVKNYMQQYIR